MRQWQDADATHLPVSTLGASQKTVDHHLAALATAAEAADDQRLRAACGSRSQDPIFHVTLGFWNSGSRQHVRTVYYYVRMTASPGRRHVRASSQGNERESMSDQLIVWVLFWSCPELPIACGQPEGQ